WPNPIGLCLIQVPLSLPTSITTSPTSSSTTSTTPPTMTIPPQTPEKHVKITAPIVVVIVIIIILSLLFLAFKFKFIRKDDKSRDDKDNKPKSILSHPAH